MGFFDRRNLAGLQTTAKYAPRRKRGGRRRNTQIPKTQHDKTVVITLKICTEIQEGVPLLIIPIRHDIIWKIYIFLVGNVSDLSDAFLK